MVWTARQSGSDRPGRHSVESCFKVQDFNILVVYDQLKRQHHIYPQLRSSSETLCTYFPAMIADTLIAKSRIDRCSSAPSTNRLSTSEKIRTILFFWGSGMVSSYVRAWYN